MATLYPETKSFIFTFFSKLMGREVVDRSGNVAGKVFDIITVQAEIYPKAVELVINRGFFKQTYAHVPWTALAEINGQVRLNVAGSTLKFQKMKESRAEISLRRDPV